jgi:shikimate dehydrogenase
MFNPEAQQLRICGSTDVYLILGDPVEQVKAPESFNAIFQRFGIDAVLVPAHVPVGSLQEFVRAVFKAPNIRGLWVTIPHKTPITAMLRDCDELGRIAGAVNAVRRNADGSLSGALFDGEGFVASLDHFAIPWRGRRVLVIGAGGAGAAIGASLTRAAQPVAALAFYDPLVEQSHMLTGRLAPHTSARVSSVDSNDPAGYDLVINASPLGLAASDPLPCDVARMAPRAALVDILMKNQPTPIVRAARARGLVAQPGFEMMIQQAHLYLDFFGFHAAARAVREDSDFLREPLAPAAADA